MQIKEYADTTNIAQIRDKIRKLLKSGETYDEILVSIAPGIYNPRDFQFTAEDCSSSTKVIYEARSGAVINGGVTVNSDKWQNPDSAMAERFDEKARPYIKMLSLTSLGLTRSDWGEDIAIGAYNTAGKYDDAPSGCGSEFFCGDRRMIKARYPDYGEFAKLDAVADVGDTHEFPPQNYYEDWNERRNHRGGAYIIDKAMNERVKRWRQPHTAWMFGYIFWDWADSSSPVTFNTANRVMYPKFVSGFGARAGAPYYIYNVAEELDCEGEWYLDRENGNLYFYPYKDAQTADFSFKNIPLISGTDICNMTFSGFTLMCTMTDAISVKGSDIIFENTLIKNVFGNGICVTGERNRVDRCEITHTGRGGIILTGGDRQTLTHGGNVASNNYIHDFSEIYLTYQAGISLHGVGNIAEHNEIANTPHEAISYSGNEHLIEYNYIHEAVMQSNDAGAIYSGRDSTAYGTVIRYNKLENIGGGIFHPQGIYWDDALSGQSAYGNILINVGQHAFLIGGGRENVVENNIIIENGGSAIEYDSRMLEGYRYGGWYSHYMEHWTQIENSPRYSEPWCSRYPKLAKISLDEAMSEDIDFITNPSYSSVKNNIIIAPKGELYCVSDYVFNYSDISDNFAYASKSDAGWDDKSGDLSSDSRIYGEHPEFKAIPDEKIGIIRGRK